MAAGVLVLLLMAGAPSAGEQRGVGPPVDEVRSRMRASFVVAPSVISLLRTDEFGVLSGWGFGLSLELGLVALDRATFSLQATGAALFLTDGRATPGFSGGPGFDWFLSDHWTIGAGAHLLVASAAVLAPVLMVPLRVHWRLAERGPSAVARRSFVVGFQLGLGSSMFRFVPHFTGLLTVGYGWW